jgi:AraC-like DNA-binding protein
MLTFYVIILIIVVIIWRYGINKYRKAWKKRNTVIEELKRQREEIKLASDELRQPMARMTTIIGDMSMREQSLEGREQLNSLHFQLLQVITRISEMQTTLENPEKKAESTAKDRLELNEQGEIELAVETGQQLSLDIKPLRVEGQTQKFCVVFIDNNREFLQFMRAHLCEIYDFHIYDNIKDAIPDIETLKADLVVCKHNMGDSITGSELCNQFKSSHNKNKTKFVLMTDTVLTPESMNDLNITLAADDYLAKPFNVQEAVMRFNKVMGLAPIEINQNVIEGKETRMLEGQNASMTTATMSFEEFTNVKVPDSQETTDTPESQETLDAQEVAATPEQPNILAKYYDNNTIGDYSMSNIMDQQLMRNVEQFVLQNMSRGQISLEDMAAAMGMGRVPFFHKIRAITTKTPAELVREIRLKHACTLLVTTNINLSELALNVGFMTAENFINIFRDKYGMTPLEYRLKNKR